MQRISLLLSVLVICLITTMQAQTPAPQPGPELQKLHVFVGHWTGQGERKAGPWGPGSQYTFEETDEMILDGLFLQTRATLKDANGEHHLLLFEGYDPDNKNYPTIVLSSSGKMSSGTTTCDGNTWTFTRKSSIGGKNYALRLTMAFASDLMSVVQKDEVSYDGATWEPVGGTKFTRVSPAPKK